jgi:hypothetical protein
MQKNKQIFSLARDILRKIKKDNVKLSNILLQAAELSHLTEINENIKFFMEGSKKVEKSQIYLDTYTTTIEAAKDPSISITSANPNEIVGWSAPRGNYLERQNIKKQRQDAIQTIAHYKTQTYEFAMKIYYAYLFGSAAETTLEEYKKIATREISKKFPELKQSFDVINKNYNSNNPKEWVAAVNECRNIFINLSGQLWKSKKKEFTRKNKDKIDLGKEKNKLIAYLETKIKGSNLERARAEKLCSIVHEVFTIGGKSKRKIDKNELFTAVVDTYIFLADLTTYTDLQPIE